MGLKKNKSVMYLLLLPAFRGGHFLLSFLKMFFFCRRRTNSRIACRAQPWRSVLLPLEWTKLR